MYSVLIVDDSAILRKSIKRSRVWGDVSGFSVTGEAEDGSSAVEELKRHQYDLVITDIKMPNMDGIELMENISRDRLCPFVVLLSDYTEYSYARQGILYGASDYVGKPLRDTELSALLGRIKERLDLKKSLEKSDDHVFCGSGLIPKVKCFGKFEFTVGGQEIKFTTQKARELFVFLLCNSYRSIRREELLEVFFNTGNEKRDANNLRVTIFRVRQALLAANVSKEHILIKDDFSVTVAPAVCDITDFFEFFSRNSMIDKNCIAEASRISDTVNGELVSDIDAFWVAELREYFAVEIERLLIGIAVYYNYTAFKPLKAEYVLLKLIELNPLSEQGHLALLDTCLKTNNRGKYLYYYRRYRECISKELDCLPEEKYKEYYEKFSK